MTTQKDDDATTWDSLNTNQTGDESNQPALDSKGATDVKVKSGLYVVATPIGHAQDITLRALSLLKAADIILCEDTRVTAKLLMMHGIQKKKTMAYHEHNAEKMRPKVLDFLSQGLTLALVSDAGTPLINDPGYKLVRDCQDAGHYVSAAPGPSSVINALVLSGLPSDRFLYLGFLPNKSAARQKALNEVRDIGASLIALESPRRVAACLQDMVTTLGAEREAAVTRELTKRFEEIRRAPLGDLARFYADNPPKGEVVLIVGPPSAQGPALEGEELDAVILDALGRLSVRDAVAEVVAMTGLKKREVYNRALALQKETPEG